MFSDRLLKLSLYSAIPVTNTVNLTVDIFARLLIIDAVAVADIETAPGAVPPNRVLDEPGKHRGKRRIEGLGVDPFGHGFDDVGAGAAA
jgi:hypothetical protein